MSNSKNPEALRIIAKQMDGAETFRTDELGVEAACLRDSADEIERLRAENERLRKFSLKALTVVEVVAGEGVVLVYPAYDADDLLMEGCDLLGVEDAEGVRAALGEERK